MVKIRVLPPMPILKDFHRNYRSALLMDNFKLIYRYDKERDEIIIFFIPYYILKGLSRCSKLIAYMNLIKKVMLSNASTPSFGPYAQLSSVV